MKKVLLFSASILLGATLVIGTNSKVAYAEDTDPVCASLACGRVPGEQTKWLCTEVNWFSPNVCCGDWSYTIEGFTKGVANPE